MRRVLLLSSLYSQRSLIIVMISKIYPRSQGCWGPGLRLWAHVVWLQSLVFNHDSVAFLPGKYSHRGSECCNVFLTENQFLGPFQLTQKLDLCTRPRLQDHLCSKGSELDGLWMASKDVWLQDVINVSRSLKGQSHMGTIFKKFGFLQLGPLSGNITTYSKLNV